MTKKTNRLHFANGGHNFPLLKRINGNNLEPLVARGMRMGNESGAQFCQSEVQLSPGDRIFLFTDGIIECENSRGEMFGQKRFQRMISGLNTPRGDLMNELISKEISSFAGRAELQDDITIVSVEVEG